MDAIRSWWEVPCIAHFCHIFAKPFKLPEFEIEELEDTLLLDAPEEDLTPSLLVKLYCSLLNGIVDKEVAEENWEFFLKMHLQWRTDYLNEEFNPHDGKNYKQLDTRTKVEILHRICHWRMELDDVGDLLRGLDGSLLRVEPLGSDEDGNIYWYFYGTRLYAEQSKKKKKANSEGTPNKGKGARGKGRSKEAGKNGRKKNNKDEQQKEDSPVVPEESGWKIVCSTSEEWNELIEKLRESRKTEAKRLCNYLDDELLPEVQYMLQQKEKIFKKKLLAELPRRTSDRIAQKALKEEEEHLDALRREIQREEQRKEEEEERVRMEEEAEKKHQEKLEEVIRRRKARKEKQQEQRQKEEQNWSLALSGELSGPRKAAIGAVQGVVQTQSQSFIEEKDEDLYTDMYKVMTGLRKVEDSWVFEEPVTEDIAPGYFEAIDQPMDFQTVEKKMESGKYISREQFSVDIEMIFNNCKEYNGEDSEYYDLANEMLDLFQKLMKQIHQESLLDEDEEGSSSGRRKKKKSPSPELTSESSEESSDEDEGVDENEEDESDRKKKKKSSNRPLGGEPFLMQPQMVNPTNPGMFRPHPQMYPPPHMMHPHMRPAPHVSPEMMGYPPHPYYGGPPPPRHPYQGGPPPHHHPMHMRPSQQHPREPFMSHESYRYPYPMNGMPPPPYGHPMMSPEQQQQMMQRRMMGHPPYPMNGGPLPPQPSMMPPQRMPGASQLPEPSMPTTTKDGTDGQRVSSPRVSSTVKTPPTSGDEKGDDDNKATKDQEQGDDNPPSKEDDVEKAVPINNANDRSQQQQQPVDTSKASASEKTTNGPTANPPPTHPPQQQQPHPSHSQHPLSVHPQMQQQMRGGYPQAMMDERQRYYHAMMMRRQQYMMAQGYPPPPPSHEDPYYNWSGGQRPPPPYGPGQQPQPSHQAAMMERQRYMEYQMRMRAVAAAPPSSGSMPRPQGAAVSSSEVRDKEEKKDNTEKKNTSRETDDVQTPGKKDNGEDDIPDYHDSLTQYARGLATGEEEQKQEKEKDTEMDKSASKETKPDQEGPPISSSPKQTHKENSEAKYPNRNVQNGPHMQGRPNWPHPNHPSHMVPNGYDGSMMAHPHYANMMPSQHMYGPGPHLSPHPNMSYPTYQDPSRHYNMMTPEMEQWRYMEMQRQWMARHHQGRMSPQDGMHKGLKRPLPRTPIPLDKHVHNNAEEMEPPTKQPKLSEGEEKDKDLEEEEAESGASEKEATSLET